MKKSPEHYNDKGMVWVDKGSREIWEFSIFFFIWGGAEHRKLQAESIHNHHIQISMEPTEKLHNRPCVQLFNNCNWHFGFAFCDQSIF